MEIGIALGTNLGDKVATLRHAIDLIAHEVGELRACSRLYITSALVPPERAEEIQPDYVNAVIVIETRRSPRDVLNLLQDIERRLGRIRSERWCARTIDLDLLFAGDTMVNTPELQIPHPELPRRDFVLVPLVDVAPAWTHPMLNQTAKELLATLVEEKRQTYVKEVFER